MSETTDKPQGTFACPICGVAIPHDHDEQTKWLWRNCPDVYRQLRAELGPVAIHGGHATTRPEPTELWWMITLYGEASFAAGLAVGARSPNVEHSVALQRAALESVRTRLLAPPPLP